MLIFILFAAWIAANLIRWLILGKVPKYKHDWRVSISRKDNPDRYWRTVVLTFIALGIVTLFIVQDIYRHGFQWMYSTPSTTKNSD